jgi:hypothetical protein
MNNDARKHYTRSMARTQEFTPLSESDRNLDREQKDIKMDVNDSCLLDTVTIQLQHEMLS